MKFATPSRLVTLAILAAVAMVCFVNLGVTPLYETDEGFAATRADSFSRHHSWLLSYDDVDETGPQYRKPPLLYWCVAALYEVIGRNLWAVRLPTALAAFTVVLLTWRLARRYVDDRCALTGAALLVTVPFAVLHIRTAMLEMPLLALLLAGIWSFAFAPHAAQRVLGAGLAGGAAILLKGGAGAYVTLVPLLFGLIQRRFQRRACLEALLVPLVALLPPLLYFVLIPQPYRTEMVQHLFVEEAAVRVRVFNHFARQMHAALSALATPMRWHTVAATLGLLVMLRDAIRRRAWPAWPILTLLIALPLLWVFATMVHPFARYLLPLYPFLLVLGTYFIWQATATRSAAWWLLPYAAGALALGWRDPWVWGPVATALLILATAQIPSWSQAPARTALARTLLLLGLAIPSTCSSTSWSLHPRPALHPRPELIPLARQLENLVPAGQRIVTEDGMKCHTLLFYGRRPIDTLTNWLLTQAAPGEIRYGVFSKIYPAGIPNLHVTSVAQSGPWHLLRLQIDEHAQPWAGILFCHPHQALATSNTLALLNITAAPFSSGFQLQTCPPAATHLPLPPENILLVRSNGVTQASPTPPATWTLTQGDALVLTIPPGAPCLGLELRPASKREILTGLRVDAQAANESAWRHVKLVDQPFDPTYELAGLRLQKTVHRAIRIRLDPLQDGQLRIIRTAEEPLNVAAINLFMHSETANRSGETP